MKKVFPWIVVLITLSLLGIIYIQTNWIKNAVKMKQDEYNIRLLQTLDNVRMIMVQGAGGEGLGAVQNTGSGNVQNSLTNESFAKSIFRQAPVWTRYSVPEIRKIIQQNLSSRGLEIPFDFALMMNQGMLTIPELYSPNYYNAIKDSVHNELQYIPLSDDQSLMSTMIGNHEMLFLVTPKGSQRFILKSLGWTISGALLFTLIIIMAFTLTVNTMLRQKKMSEIKSDFINNMTHEFKTPLATISLAIDAIGNEKVIDSKDRIRYFSGIIKEENKRMNKQVETILQSALLEKQEIKLNKEPIDVHEVLRKNIDNLQLQLQHKNGKVNMHLDASNPVIDTDEVHFSNIISNLLDNAIKYSRDAPEITVATSDNKKGVVISVADNGIGMSKETLARIFEKFYRAHTGNLHNVKGFGLGLAYVKAIMDAHQGKVRVESTPGKGSRFSLEFPQV